MKDGGMSETSLFLGMLCGCIGLGYLVYAMRQRRGVALLSGVVLAGAPYFIASIWVLVPIMLGAMILPFYLRY